MSDRVDAQYKALRANFRRIERREWWLWVSAFLITLLLTVALASFLLPGAHLLQDFNSEHMMSQAMRGLVALVFLFDLYTIYQHLLIHRIRRELVEREELFHLISENAADMIAVVDMHGKRLLNSLSYQRVLGYSPEELQASSAFEQIHPDDRERVKKSSRGGSADGNRKNAPVSPPTQKRLLARAGIHLQRHSQFQRRAGKTGHRESRYHRAQKSRGSLAAF